MNWNEKRNLWEDGIPFKPSEQEVCLLPVNNSSSTASLFGLQNQHFLMEFYEATVIGFLAFNVDRWCLEAGV
jgi:hypothetical protein